LIGKYRDLWEHYFIDSDAILFVIDSSDTLRISVVKEELEMVLAHKNIKSRRIPLLVLGNKMDLPQAMSPSDIVNALSLESIKDRNWTIW
jgi:ADP-ribosylation factor-like protein 6